MRSFFLLVLAGLLAVMVTSSARAQYVDEELWLGSGLKQAINKDLSWSLQWENRWTQGMRWHDQGLLDVAIEYQWDKHWSMNAQWRFSERQQKEGGYVPRQRGALRLLGDWKAGRGKVKGRLMWTEDWNPLLAWRDLRNDTLGTNDADALRIRTPTSNPNESWRELGGVLPRRGQMERTVADVGVVGRF